MFGFPVLPIHRLFLVFDDGGQLVKVNQCINGAGLLPQLIQPFDWFVHCFRGVSNQFRTAQRVIVVLVKLSKDCGLVELVVMVWVNGGPDGLTLPDEAQQLADAFRLPSPLLKFKGMLVCFRSPRFVSALMPTVKTATRRRR